MSSKYIKMYIGSNDKEGLELVRDVFKCIENKEYDSLITKYGASANLLVGCSKEGVDVEIVKGDMNHLLDFQSEEQQNGNSIAFCFDAFVSLDEDYFLKFFIDQGMTEIETLVEHSGVGATYLLLNDQFIEASASNSCKLIPKDELTELTLTKVSEPSQTKSTATELKNREDSITCPSCSKAPPIGSFWQCDSCGTSFDTFEHKGICPGCKKVFKTTSCPYCGKTTPLENWYKPNVTVPKSVRIRRIIIRAILVLMIGYLIYKYF